MELECDFKLTHAVAVGTEHLVGLSDGALDRLALFTVFLKLVKIGDQVLNVVLVLSDFDLTTHPGAKLLLEVRKVNVSLALRVQYVVHQAEDLILAGMDLVPTQVLLKVLIADEAITVLIDGREGFIKARFAFKSSVLKIGQNLTHPLGLAVVHRQGGVPVGKLSIQNLWGRVRPPSSVDDGRQLVGILLVNERSDRLDVCATMLVEHKGAHKTFDILLCHLAGDQLIAALLHQEGFEVVNVQVTVFICTSFFSDSFFKSSLICVFTLQVTVHFHETFLNVLDGILRNFLSV